MPCTDPSHTHQWPSTGDLYLYECERFCAFCMPGARSFGKEWDWRCHLLKHVQQAHINHGYSDLSVHLHAPRQKPKHKPKDKTKAADLQAPAQHRSTVTKSKSTKRKSNLKERVRLICQLRDSGCSEDFITEVMVHAPASGNIGNSGSNTISDNTEDTEMTSSGGEADNNTTIEVVAPVAPIELAAISTQTIQQANLTTEVNVPPVSAVESMSSITATSYTAEQVGFNAEMNITTFAPIAHGDTPANIHTGVGIVSFNDSGEVGLPTDNFIAGTTFSDVQNFVDPLMAGHSFNLAGFPNNSNIGLLMDPNLTGMPLTTTGFNEPDGSTVANTNYDAEFVNYKENNTIGLDGAQSTPFEHQGVMYAPASSDPPAHLDHEGVNEVETLPSDMLSGADNDLPSSVMDFLPDATFHDLMDDMTAVNEFQAPFTPLNEMFKTAAFEQREESESSSATQEVSTSEVFDLTESQHSEGTESSATSYDSPIDEIGSIENVDIDEIAKFFTDKDRNPKLNERNSKSLTIDTHLAMAGENAEVSVDSLNNYSLWGTPCSTTKSLPDEETAETTQALEVEEL